VRNIEVASKKGKSAVLTDSLGQFEPLGKRLSSEDSYITANLIFKDSEINRQNAIGMGYMKPDQLFYTLLHLSHKNNDFCRIIFPFFCQR
jgi:hypothetical protein